MELISLAMPFRKPWLSPQLKKARKAWRYSVYRSRAVCLEEVFLEILNQFRAYFPALSEMQKAIYLLLMEFDSLRGKAF